MKLFIGGLSWNMDKEDLRSAFERFGDIEDARVITDRDTGRSRGFGFVTFVNRDDALKAIAEMDNSELGGRAIKVNEAREREPRQGGGGGGGGRGGYNRGGGHHG